MGELVRTVITSTEIVYITIRYSKLWEYWFVYKNGSFCGGREHRTDVLQYVNFLEV
ncbi:hypothetical protein M2451_003902 [Dysgonomonas sp. PFB1-18]|nr:hypothetical protein [Dysgonomonas sp. PF1-14]MDH6341108.1 hypothetical protein [Dysgonomonas sp. PF1-16]MDH6382561.1 hypothetical protein [Dysgonomonas sp. PFB1-18]MDH6399905.1 hypothetical protein [Dysgonomonas sp. PF1-23]